MRLLVCGPCVNLIPEEDVLLIVMRAWRVFRVLRFLEGHALNFIQHRVSGIQFHF